MNSRGGARGRRAVAGVLVAGVLGCPADRGRDGGGSTSGAPVVASSSLAVAGAPDAAAGVVAGGVVGVNRAVVRGAADEKSRSVALVNYGEKVEVLEKADAFWKVRLTDGQEGFISSKAVLPGPVQEATLVAEQDLYARPDALSPVKKREKRGVLLFVTADRDGWRQVHLPDQSNGWVPRDRANTELPELVHARALHVATHLLADKQQDRAVQVLREALAAHPAARLAPSVEARLLPLLPPDAGQPADAGPPAPPATATPPTQPGLPLDAGAASGATVPPPVALAADAGVRVTPPAP